MTKKKIAFIIFVILSTLSFSQTITIKGVVKDSLQNPLSYANVIAKPEDISKNLQFSITDDDGRYKLELTKNNRYTISVSYMGYKTASFKFVATENLQKNIVLSEAPNQLQEVVIELPVTVKEDTITYNTNKFVTGEERKLKQVLKKLPGIEVDKNGTVTVQGKKITTMLVEGKKFFGGGSKLAVENIPANAIDKIQVLDNYSEIAFLKNVSDTDEMAMNILLKEDKKQFAFGDVEAGKGNEDFYRTHSNIFYYSPKTNINFIGNLNNTGEKTFTFKDYLSFQGGLSSVFDRKFNWRGGDFLQFMETQDVVASSNKFGALNISKTVNTKLDISGYAIFSHTNTDTFTTINKEYITDSFSFFEDKEDRNSTRSILGIGKFNIEYAPNTNEQWYIKTQVKKTSNLGSSTILSVINTENINIQTTKDAIAYNVNQNIEWHKKVSKKHTFSVAVDYVFDKNNPTTYWKTNQQILQGLIPLETENVYNLTQLKETKRSNFNAIFKHYWVLNNTNHIYTTIGNAYINEQFYTSDSQQLENGSENNFSIAGFGNDLDYTLNDLFVGIHYKFKTGIFTFKQGAFLHKYNWELNQTTKVVKNKILLLPNFLAEVKFSNSKKIKVKYQLKSSFSDASKLANRFYLQSYNSVFKGNEQLENELFHSARIRYSRFSLYRGLMLSASANYSKKIKEIRSAVEFDGINQFLTIQMLENPSEDWDLNASVRKRIKKIRYKFSGNYSNSKYFQSVNNSFVINKNENYTFNIGAETLFDNFPTIEFGLGQSFGNYTSNSQTTKFSNKEPYLNIDYDFLKGFIFSFDYIYTKYENKSFNQRNTYQIANTTLFYKKEDSAWSFKINAQNLFNVQFKQQNSFSSYIISDSKTYILPRIIMVSIGYNL